MLLSHEALRFDWFGICVPKPHTGFVKVRFGFSHFAFVLYDARNSKIGSWQREREEKKTSNCPDLHVLTVKMRRQRTRILIWIWIWTQRRSSAKMAAKFTTASSPPKQVQSEQADDVHKTMKVWVAFSAFQTLQDMRLCGSFGCLPKWSSCGA